MSIRIVLGTLGVVVTLAGCQTAPQKYDWGNYDPSLYAYYKDSTKLGELTASLQAVIEASDASRLPVPPGIYAEYGYLQLQQGKTHDAAQSFKLEETHWPESKVFMEHMIQVASTPSPGLTGGNAGQ
ncbi:MAG: DUF4810 domain-containing protein [Candidatus Acidiferrales bacterium]